MTNGTDKMLYKWEALIDAEGRCENYWFSGYASFDYSNRINTFDVMRKIRKNLEDDGEIVLDIKVENAGNVISF